MIKTFEEACKKLSIDPNKIISGSCLLRYSKSLIAYQKLQIICEVLNQGWQSNWDNSSEYKYTPYFNMNFDFSFKGVNVQSVNTYTTSTLYFASYELAEYAGKQFLEIWKDYLEIDNSQKHAREQMMEIENTL